MSDRVSSHRALPSQRSRRLHGFTVVEVLVVVTVIGVLAMFTFGSAQSTWDQEVQTRLRSDVQALALRIEAQFERTGKYPTTANLYGVTQTAFPGLAPSTRTQWALTNVTTDQRGATVIVQDIRETSHYCLVGIP
jgi:prepilin-type N-terminal cleavage/methylation domain-containing protein